MKKWTMLVFMLAVSASPAFAQSLVMTTAQKVQLTVAAVDAANAPVPVPQTGVTLQWSSTCPTCTLTGSTYDTTAKVWMVWFNAGTDLGAFTVALTVTYNSGGQKFSASQPVTIHEVIIVPASVKVVAGVPVNK